MMKSWRLEERVISTGNDCDWSFTQASTNETHAHMHSSGSCEYEDGKNVWTRFWDFLFFMMSRLFFSMYTYSHMNRKKAGQYPALSYSDEVP
jgi:hypothetical protein